MKVRYKGDYYIATEPVLKGERYTCQAWRYRSGVEIASEAKLRGIAEAIKYRRRRNETHIV